MISRSDTTSIGFLFSVTGAYNKSFPSMSDKQSRTGVARSTAVIDSGRTIAEGTPAEIQAHPEVISAYLGTKSEAGNARG